MTFCQGDTQMGESLGSILTEALAKRHPDKVEVHRETLEDAAKALAAAGNKIAAIKLVRSYTGWGLVETKNYVENGFARLIAVGSRVQCGGEKYIVKAIVPYYGGDKVYWCFPLVALASIRTFFENDIELVD